MKKFIHKGEEIIKGYKVPQTEEQIENHEVPETIDNYVPGYSPCVTCGTHPSYSFNSKKPDEVIVITCDHGERANNG